jgi:hypothetical protein
MKHACVAALAMVGAGCVPSGASLAERQVALSIPGPLAVTYPEMLRAADIEGYARIRFVLDSTGRPIRRSMRTLGASHEIFAAGLRRNVLRWSFKVENLNQGGTLGDSITADARYVLEDGPTCPHPPRCSSEPVQLPQPTERVEGGRGSQVVEVTIVSCPMPERAACISSIVVPAI